MNGSKLTGSVNQPTKKWKDISIFMTKESQQRVDGIKLHQQVVEVWHCGDHMHFLDNVVQIQLWFHKPDFKKAQHFG